MKFPVMWHIESPRSPNGIFECKQEEVTPLLTAEAVWGLLRTTVPNLLENPIIRYRGFLKPGLTISVEIPRENVRVSVAFEVIAKGCITFTHEVFLNMVTWREIHAHYSSIDHRICPWENYIDEDLRPYYSETQLRFRLNKSLEIPDTTHNFGGVSGGQTPTGLILPPIVFPKPPINTASPASPKVPGSATGQLDSDSSSDSWEDELIPERASDEQRFQMMMEADEHELRKMEHAIAKGLGVTVEIWEDYAFEVQVHEVIFSKEFRVAQFPAHVLEMYQLAYKEIERIGASFQGGLPASIIWADSGVPREDIDLKVLKLGQGIIARYSYRKSMALSMANLPERIRAQLPLEWSVQFGTSENPVDLELTRRMANITSQLDPANGQYMLPWQVHLAKASLRVGEFGIPAAEVYKTVGRWDDYRQIPVPPMCAKEMPTFVEATSVKESQAMLRFGRDSNWPIKITVATKASPATMLAITHDTDWEGLTTTEEGETEFLSQAKAFLVTSHNLDVIAHIPGEWEIRAGSVYEIREIRQLTLKCKDQDNRDFAIKIQGTK
jgi:hypothetical protein